MPKLGRDETTRPRGRSGLAAGWRFVGAIGVLTMASLTAFSTSSAADPITHARSEAAQLQQEIHTTGMQIGALNQEWDGAQLTISRLSQKIARIDVAISRDQKTVAADRVILRNAAVNQYVTGKTASSVNSLFSSNPMATEARTEYSQVAEGNITDAVGQLHTTQARLRIEQATLAVQKQQAANAADRAQAELARAQELEQQQQAELNQVTGQLAVLIQQQQQAQQQAAEQAAAALLAAAQSAASSTTSSSPSQSGSSSLQDAPPASGAAAAVAAAESQIGVPYVWGGSTPRGTPGDPSGGFDCSGLVMWAWAQAGVSLPHYSGAQYDAIKHIPMSDLEPGDIVFFANPGQHEAMYIGGGQVIQAPYTGTTVQIVPLYPTFVLAGRP